MSTVAMTTVTKDIYHDNILIAKCGLKVREELLYAMLRKGYMTFDEYLAYTSDASDEQKAKAFISYSVGTTIPCVPEDVAKFVDDLLIEIIDSGKAAKAIACLSRKSLWSYKHSMRVAIYAATLATMANKSDEIIRIVAEGAIPHDVGKIYHIRLVNKPDKLTNEEYEIMKNHTVSGYNFLTKANFRKEIAEIALYHHERRDGSGYWHKTDIPDYVEIVALADCIDAMLSARPYKKMQSAHAVISKLYAEQRATHAYDDTLLKTAAAMLLGMQKSQRLYK